MFKTIVFTLLAIFLTGFASYEPAAVCELHAPDKLASRVFEVRDEPDGGGGTGFAVDGLSGKTYIVTNSHVCEVAKSNEILVIQDKLIFKRKILKLSDKSDLCIIEGVPGVKGLKLGTGIKVNEEIFTVGHPNLGPLAIGIGKVRKFEDTEMFHHTMATKNPIIDMMIKTSPESCNKPKNFIKQATAKIGLLRLAQVKNCWVRETNSVSTTIIILPGSSGSPVFNKQEEVVGVILARNIESNWGIAVNLSTLKDFLQNF